MKHTAESLKAKARESIFEQIVQAAEDGKTQLWLTDSQAKVVKEDLIHKGFKVSDSLFNPVDETGSLMVRVRWDL